MEMQFKTLMCVTKAVDPEQGIYEVLISSEKEDRDKDILLAAGAQVANFERNPVVLYAHNYAGLPVAKATKVEAVPGTGLKATMQFPPRGASAEADTVHTLWSGGFLNAASVGFIPHKWENRPGPNGEMPQEGYESYWWPHGKIFTSWELLEFSIVPVPANADALRLSASALGKRGRVLSAANEQKLRSAYEAIGHVLSQLGDAEPEDDGKGKGAGAGADPTSDELGELAASLAELSESIYGV